MIYQNNNSGVWGYYLTCGVCEPSGSDRAKFTFQQCTHIVEYITEGADKDFLADAQVGNIYAVRATFGSRSQVEKCKFIGWTRIEVTDVFDGYIAYKMNHLSSFFESTINVDLGLLSPGEGLLTASRALMDWIMSQCHPEERWGGPLMTNCKSRFHRVPQQRNLAAQDYAANPDMKMLMLASMILEGSCIFCVIESTVEDDYGMSDDFGLPDRKTADMLAAIRKNKS